MRKWWVITTVLVTIIGVPLGQMLWKPSPEMPVPTASQLPFFIVLSIIEAVGLGLAVSFLIFGKKIVDSVISKSKNLAWAVYISIAWLLGNWWIHDKLHMANGMNLQGLLYIEYCFHLTLIVSGAVLAYAFFHPFLHAKK